MKKLMCKSLSVCLVLICIFSVFLSPNTFALNKDVSNEKIKSNLSEELSTLTMEDTVHVSIWFSDINQENIKEKTEQHFVNAKSSNSMDASAIKILNSDMDEDVIEMFKDDTYSEDVQDIIEIKRGYLKSEYKLYNDKIKARIIDTVSLSEDNIVYVSTLAPNIEANLTKKQIYDLAKSDFITDIYSVEDKGYSIDLFEESKVKSIISGSSYSEHLFRMTGLDTTRDAFGLTGNGVNVGIFDESYLNEDYINTHFSNVLVETYPTLSGETQEDIDNQINMLNINNHTYNLLTIISGYRDNGTVVFNGGVPNANVFVSNQHEDYYTSTWKSCIEWLVSEKGCNVINMSRHASYFEGYDTYGDNAKWIDHIATTHNVHIVMATGNCSKYNYIRDVTLAHNAIAVGSVDINGAIESESAYSARYDQPYKPEIVAPGTDVYLPTTSSPTYGTSYAAPLVTCAVAQMCEVSAILRYNPPLMKAVIMSGAKHNNLTDYIPLSQLSSTNISLGRECGAGMLYAPNSYISFVDNSRYTAGTMSPYSTGVIKSVRVNRTGKLLRVVATWDKMNIVEDNQSFDEESCDDIEFVSKELDQFYLMVTTPSGNTYTSFYQYDNKQAVSFLTEETGTYRIYLFRYEGQNSGQIVRYGISYSLINN